MTLSHSRVAPVASNPPATKPPANSNLECCNCDNQISASRLEALPDTKICIECAEAKEEWSKKKMRYGTGSF
jgi:formylmethanofuran dehydrogenase subunit E